MATAALAPAKRLPQTALIGRVTEVEGSCIIAQLLETEEVVDSPVITIGDEDILVGQLGSYVAIRQGGLNVVAIVTRMTEQERTSLAPDGEDRAPKLPVPQRSIHLVPIGTVNESGEFERGVAAYPTTGAEVHALAAYDIDLIFSKYKSKNFDVGYLSSHPSLGAYLDPTALFGRHFAILGQTGAGKSWTVATVVQRTVKVMPKAHIILLDLHGEYCWAGSDGSQKSAFSPEIVRYIDARALEIPYWLMTFAELCDLMIDRTETAAHNQTAFFRETLAQLKAKEKTPLGLERVTVDTPVHFSLDDLLSQIEQENTRMIPSSRGEKQGPNFGSFDRFLMRLSSRLNDVRYDFLLKPKNRNSSDSLSPLLRDFVGLGQPKRPITVIDLSSVPFDVRPTVAAQIGRLAFEFNYWNPQYRDFPILLICEEAHAYIPREHEAQYAGSRKSMERIAKEGRKYGVGLGVVSQRPREVSETVLAQCGTFLCLRLTNPDDQAYVRSLVPEAERDLMDIVAGLARGEAVVLGEAAPLPTRFRFHKPSPNPNSDDIDFYEKWRSGPDDIDVDEIVKRWRSQTRD
jgi:hypothetical protein